MNYIGRLNKNKIGKFKELITTDKVIITNERIKHINERQNTGNIGSQASAPYGTGYSERNKSADEILLERSLNKELGLDGKSRK